MVSASYAGYRCADDAARRRDGSPPLVRTVPTDEGVVPYFSAHGRVHD